MIEKPEKHENLTVRLFIELYAKSKLSMKSRERYYKKEDYFLARQQSESEYIQKVGFDDVFRNATLQEIENMEINSTAPHYWNESVLLEILIATLKTLINYGDESLTEKIGVIHSKYLELKGHFSYLPQEDAFADYVNSKGDRELIETWRNSANPEGCIWCLKRGKIRSNGTMWVCDNCKRSWRKR